MHHIQLINKQHHHNRKGCHLQQGKYMGVVSGYTIAMNDCGIIIVVKRRQVHHCQKNCQSIIMVYIYHQWYEQ